MNSFGISWFRSATVAVAVASLASTVTVPPVLAKEIWVAPTHLTTPGLSIFPWPTTGQGFVVLGFAVPDDFASFESATIGLLPRANVSSTFDVFGNVKRHGESAAPGLLTATNVPATLSAGVIEDVDISTLLSGQLDATSAGNDYVSVFFWFPTSPALDVATVLGMRFVYVEKPLEAVNLAEGSVTNAKIANGAVGLDKLGSDSVDSSKVVPDSLTSGDLAADAVGASELAPDSVLGVDIVDGTVTGADIANAAVTGVHVAPGSLSAVHLRDEAGADWASGEQNLALTNTEEIVRSVSVTAPTPGFVVVNASASLFYNNVPGTIRCSLTTGTSLDFSHLITKQGTGTLDTNFDSFAATRGFVVAPGTTSFNLVCQEYGGDVALHDSSVTALFVPARY